MSPAEKESLLSDFNRNPPAVEASIDQINEALGGRLPREYIDFLRDSDGGEGFIGESYLILWRVEEFLELNEEYQVSEYAPGLVLFGSNGGGEAFAFDTRDEKMSILSVPFVGMEPSLAVAIAPDFDDFLRLLKSNA